MTICCSFCNKKIKRKPSQVKRAKNNFCSKACHNEWMSENNKGENSSSYNRVRVECGFCKKSIAVPKHKAKNLKEGKVQNLFCDKHCLANWQREKFTKPANIKKHCPQCNIKYMTKNDNQKFCSQKCLSESRKVVVDLNCDFCNQPFTKKPSQILNNNFCSKRCSEQWSSLHNNTQVTKLCWTCKKEYKIMKSQDERSNSVCCSVGCLSVWKSEFYPKTEKGKKHLRRGGIKSMKKQLKHKETKPEKMTSDFLTLHNIEFAPQKPMYGKFIVDFFLPQHNMIIEVFGDYWHGNPKFYGDGDGLKPLTERQIIQQKKDKARFAYLKKCGHNVIKVWEDDIYKNIDQAMHFLKIKKII